MTEPVSPFTCPSAQPDMAEARVLGVIEHQDGVPRVVYLQGREVLRPQDVPGVPTALAGHVFRLAGRCEGARCSQFKGGQCSLGQRVVAQLEPVVVDLPSCTIRANCRWFAEQGGDVCRRCPQIVTEVAPTDAAMVAVARPGAEVSEPA